MDVPQVILILILLRVVAFFAKISFWRLSEHERLAVFSITGKFKGMRGSGLIFVNPLAEVVRMRVDMHEKRAAGEECITNDSVSVRASSIENAHLRNTCDNKRICWQ